MNTTLTTITDTVVLACVCYALRYILETVMNDSSREIHTGTQASTASHCDIARQWRVSRWGRVLSVHAQAQINSYTNVYEMS